MVIAKPANEEARVVALEKYAILDTDPEQSFDDLALLASYICKTPIAYIALVDEDRQWFKSRVRRLRRPRRPRRRTLSRQSSRHFRPAHPVLRRRPPDQRRRLRPRHTLRRRSRAPRTGARREGSAESTEPPGSLPARIPEKLDPSEGSSHGPHQGGTRAPARARPRPGNPDARDGNSPLRTYPPAALTCFSPRPKMRLS